MSNPLLEEAITLWRGRSQIQHLREYDLTPCPLCPAYVGCKGCPVHIKTERWGCEGTPYHDVHEARRAGNLMATKVLATAMTALLESCR